MKEIQMGKSSRGNKSNKGRSTPGKYQVRIPRPAGSGRQKGNEAREMSTKDRYTRSARKTDTEKIKEQGKDEDEIKSRK